LDVTLPPKISGISTFLKDEVIEAARINKASESDTPTKVVFRLGGIKPLIMLTPFAPGVCLLLSCYYIQALSFLVSSFKITRSSSWMVGLLGIALALYRVKAWP
jgi:hypothetical protein